MGKNIRKFYLVRHGPVLRLPIWYGRHIPHDLSSAHIVKHFNHLAGILPSDPTTSRWISSPYPRARKLAKAVLNVIGLEKISPRLRNDNNFIEQKYGRMEGLADSIARKLFPSYFEDTWNNAPPKGESMRMVQERVGKRLDALAKSLKPSIKDVVVFGHGGVMAAAFAHATGQQMNDVFKARKAGQGPALNYGSVIELHFDMDEGKWVGAFEYDPGIPKQSLHPE